METITRDVGEMKANERSAAEQLVGHRLRGHERLIIQVLDVDTINTSIIESRVTQSLDDWTHIYDGLSDAEVESIDAIIKTRANLTRQVP